MSSPAEPGGDFAFIGGHPSLDFANTLGGTVDEPRERLREYGDLVRWACEVGFLSQNHGDALLALDRDHPPAAERMRQRAIRLRGALYEALIAASEDRDPSAAAQRTLNAELRRAAPNMRLAWEEGGVTVGWTSEIKLDRPLGCIVQSGIELLRSDERHLIRSCDGVDCAWVFLDHTRNHSRRWCDMKMCGNRVKARRYYARHKKG